MKSKLRGFKFRKSDASKDKIDFWHFSELDELAQATQDMQDMRNCYDSLLSAAAATANSAYEFSESLRELGSCLLEKTALHDDEESGRALLMLGKVQFQLQKLVDIYRSHIFLTITNPSESLLNELRTVEDMKRQCDEKRSVYDYMVAQMKDKGRSKSGKNEHFTSQQLRTAHEEYDEEATLCAFRLKSLKQGQARSLLTQAARHHAAQLNFFRKGLKSLEAVDQHVRLVTGQQHIDYHFSGLEDDTREEGEDEGENGDDTTEGGELSFDYRVQNQGHDVVAASRNSMEVDEVDLSLHYSSAADVEFNPDKDREGLPISSREPRGSYSAPIFPERKSDPIDRLRQMQQSSRKSSAYVLPTPIDSKGVISSRRSVSHARPTDPGGRPHNLWHSSPLDQKKNEKDSSDGQQAHKESSDNNSPTLLPPPLAGRVSAPQNDAYSSSDNKKMKGQSFSGPIVNRPFATKSVSSSGPISPAELSLQITGVLTRVPNPQISSPKVSPSASPPLASSPRISELHELPRESSAYALPTPIDSKGIVSSRRSVSHARPTDPGGRPHNLWHSSPLELKKHEKDSSDGQPSAHKESGNNNFPTFLPPPLTGRVSAPQNDAYGTSDNKKLKGQSFSGPIVSKSFGTKPVSPSGPISPAELSLQVTGVISHVSNPQSSSPKVSPSASPPLASSPRISELHELPRPPGYFSSKTAKSSALVGHSAPLVRIPDTSGSNKIASMASNLASPLPTPPVTVPRSFSIPSSSQRAMTIHVSKLLDSAIPSRIEGVDSPPLTPISLTNVKPASAVPELVPHPGQARGGS
ncbi:hypothetical protein Tsubulata_015138 [Turnera subulata]|uniref:BAR domain-containing protein n=1 Tax=Turnera subulata TaxID=218843 RepID=A0A9Q0F3Z6_9ROSI|nr:hypothetical protein Tsubulata_015138 [Turnera subulata]